MKTGTFVREDVAFPLFFVEISEFILIMIVLLKVLSTHFPSYKVTFIPQIYHIQVLSHTLI